MFRFARTPHPEKQHAMIVDEGNSVVRPQPWWAVCYALGPMSAGLLPFGLYIYARRKRIPGLEFHALQSTVWNVVVAALTCFIAFGRPLSHFWLVIPVLNAAFHLWPIWRVSQGHFFAYPQGKEVTLLRSVLWLRSFRKKRRQSDIEFSTAILDMQVPPSQAKVRLLCLRGDAWRANREWERAIADYKAAAHVPCIHPGLQGRVLLMCAILRHTMGDREGAIADFAALAEMPRVGTTRRAEALCWRAVIEEELGFVEDALAHYAAVLEMPDVPLKVRVDALLDRSDLMMRKGEWAKSIADASAALETRLLPAELRATVLINRSYARNKMKDITGALADCEAAIVLPDAPPKRKASAMSVRGNLRYEQGDVQAMMADSRAALKLDPACWTAQVQLGLGLLLNGQGEAARKEYEQAVAACPAENLVYVIEQLEKALQTRGPLASSEPILAMLRARQAELAKAGPPASGKQ
jgi:tetratricopeptide (TPR) repeat protein/uncharacterized membrane protein